ncbi:MAG: hypothetical protein CVT62_10370 [Actinobacteria bacterium HGW-Actinobacteria-2]|nr:MAG: hypothetical protein CVT62_10370 [Actinobacteria bacterium HGW-Actinobacteria-2]
MTTTYPGDRRTATETLALTLTAAGQISAVGPQQRPLWTITPVVIDTTAHGSLISSGLTSTQRTEWTRRLDQASAAVSAARVLADGTDWDGGLVVVVPANPADFATVSGANDADTAAVTSCDTGTPRIVINPASFAQGDRWLTSTLTHEAVHVATDSACTSGALWVVEGMAESVAAGADSTTASANAALVKTYLAHSSLPTTLPATVASPTDYALAQLAADQVRSHLAADAPAFFQRGLKDQLTTTDVTRATAWYLAALRRLR